MKGAVGSGSEGPERFRNQSCAGWSSATTSPTSLFGKVILEHIASREAQGAGGRPRYGTRTARGSGCFAVDIRDISKKAKPLVVDGKLGVVSEISGKRRDGSTVRISNRHPPAGPAPVCKSIVRGIQTPRARKSYKGS